MKNQKSLMQWYCLQGWCSNTCEQFSESVLKTVLVCWLASETNYSVFMVMVKNAKQPRLGDGALVFLQTFAETQKVKQCNSFLCPIATNMSWFGSFSSNRKRGQPKELVTKFFILLLGFFYVSHPKSLMKNMVYWAIRKVRHTDATSFKTS